MRQRQLASVMATLGNGCGILANPTEEDMALAHACGEY